MTDGTDYFSHVDKGRDVLEGHRRRKKKLAAPLSEIPLMQAINTKRDIFPELLWIALLFHHYGYHRAIRLAVPFREALNGFDDTRSWCLLSEIAKLSTDEWSNLKFASGHHRSQIEKALSCLTVYDSLDLEFLRHDEIGTAAAVETLMLSVKRYSDRHSTGGAATLGTFIFLEAYSGKIAVPRQTLESVSMIVDRPGSDEAELAASSVRATVLAFWAAYENQNVDAGHWPSQFWRANRSLSPCEIS